MNFPDFITVHSFLPPLACYSQPIHSVKSPISTDHPTSALDALVSQQILGISKLTHQSHRDSAIMYQTYIPTTPLDTESTPPPLFNRYG